MTNLRTDEHPDGRRARSARTKTEIVEAMMDLIEEGTLQPTSEQVADRAGVGHRTVFRHFQDMDALYREIDARLQSRVIGTVKPIPPDGPVPVRVEELVAARSGVYEKVKMFRRATEIRRWESPFLQSTRRYYVGWMRERLFQTVPELEALPSALQTAVEVLLSYETWEQLRSDRKMSVRRARATLVESVCALLG